MVCRAELACRSPPRLSRCRLVLPEETGIGVVPHKAAKPAGLVIRLGLSPAVINSSPPRGVRRLVRRAVGGQLGDQFGEVAFGVVNLGGEVADSSREAAQGESGGAVWVGEVFGVEPGAHRDLVSAAERLQLFAKPHGGGDDDLMHRVDRCGAGLHRTPPGHEDYPDRFYHAVAGFRDRGGDTSYAARAAASASIGSDFPRARRVARFGRFTSTSSSPPPVKAAASPAP